EVVQPLNPTSGQTARQRSVSHVFKRLGLLPLLFCHICQTGGGLHRRLHLERLLERLGRLFQLAGLKIGAAQRGIVQGAEGAILFGCLGDRERFGFVLRVSGFEESFLLFVSAALVVQVVLFVEQRDAFLRQLDRQIGQDLVVH